VIFLRLSKGKNCISFEAVSMVVFWERKAEFKAYNKADFLDSSMAITLV
jgi:hypothetical protein